MKVLIVGGHGQLGQELQRTAPPGVHAVTLARAALDITDGEALRQAVSKIQPKAILNAAAYTAVDKAEQESHAAFAINAEGAAHLATIARNNNIPLIHVSTDFIFDGRQSTPYRPEDSPNPQGVYGASKQEGERRVQEILGEKALIVRTAWVYSTFGNNFVKTMLRLMQERESLGIVDDQIGTPTWANGLASALWKFLEQKVYGVYHWTDAGVASWYDFAQAIQEESLNLGLLHKPIILRPIPTKMYPTPASRPAFSVLDKTTTWQALDYVADHWRVALRKMLQEGIKNG